MNYITSTTTAIMCNVSPVESTV